MFYPFTHKLTHLSISFKFQWNNYGACECNLKPSLECNTQTAIIHFRNDHRLIHQSVTLCDKSVASESKTSKISKKSLFITEEKREKSTPQKTNRQSSMSLEKQSLWIIKNYLNHPQHTRLETDSATTRLQCETRACASIGGTKQAGLANIGQQPNKKQKYTALDQFFCLQKPKPAKLSKKSWSIFSINHGLGGSCDYKTKRLWRR